MSLEFSGAHDDYERLAWPMALLIYCRCIDYGDGLALFEHNAENGFHAPCDMLARLGLMREHEKSEKS